MKIHRVVTGSLEENCYIIEKENKVLLVDPGDDFLRIQKEIASREVIGVLLTHRHFDHVGALEEVVETYKCPIYERENLEEKEYKIGPFTFTILFTEGHSKDSVTYYFKKEDTMFVGDFVFRGTVGRCDLPTGNFTEMMHSIDMLKKYPNVILYPGHGDSTTLEREKMYNPYFRN